MGWAVIEMNKSCTADKAGTEEVYQNILTCLSMMAAAISSYDKSGSSGHSLGRKARWSSRRGTKLTKSRYVMTKRRPTSSQAHANSLAPNWMSGEGGGGGSSAHDSSCSGHIVRFSPASAGGGRYKNGRTARCFCCCCFFVDRFLRGWACRVAGGDGFFAATYTWRAVRVGRSDADFVL